ncbi:TonB-dependent receptor family protein [Hyphomicrobium sp.]|uniref:TonB-dependent receptor family protein n=1 Tax=Hyphomicrobium sp. TaxID=82 RepID=UPI003F7101B1
MCFDPIAPGPVRALAFSKRIQILTAASLTSLCTVVSAPVSAQQKPVATELPPVNVTTTTPKAKTAAKKTAAPTSSPAVVPPPTSEAAEANASGKLPAPGTRAGSLTVPTAAEAKADIQLAPGGVDLVPAEEYAKSTPATTIKDALDYVPGVFVQPKWGEDSRVSIRGSGLSRNFHLRGLQLYMDGIPINTADGYGDFQEIDPSVYRYIEVYKGGNALRFGANSLGGAINFVMPTGYDSHLFGARVDVGSFGFHKLSVSSGGVSGAADYFIAGTWLEQDGFRDHSDGESVRGVMNVGYRLTENVETRFYLNANNVDQRIPGSVTRDAALNDPKAAAPINVLNDWQRNIDTVRIANKTTVRLMPGTTLELGAFNVDRQLDHPIFEWLDYRYDDYGGFARITDESRIGGFANRVIAGVNLHYGTTDVKQYKNVGGEKGDPTVDADDKSGNISAYLENHFYVLPDVALVGGVQFLHATRERDAAFGAVSGETEFNLWSPKAGIVWDVDRAWQVFANVSRSAEVPSYGESVSGPPFLMLPTIPFTDIRAQRATTYEIGTRGARPNFTWDLAAYRAEIDNELMCFYSAFGNCNVSNADKTVHQGLEIGFGVAVLQSIFADGPTPDKLWLNTAYTLNDFYFDNDATFGNNELPGAPRHFLRAELLYKHPSGVYFGPNVEWVPDAYYVDSANTLETAAYALWGAKIGFDNGGPISAYIEGRNLSDEAYIASASIIDRANPNSTLFEPGTGRAIYGGVQVKW